MARTVAIGVQDFETIQRENYFYIDKTDFIREWWNRGDSVTVITRPRRFGKTLTLSMVEQFFSVKYAGKGELFQNLAVWKEKKYRELQGTYPVISLSFANVKEISYENTRLRINQLLTELYTKNSFLLDSGFLQESEQEFFRSVNLEMGEVTASMAIYKLSDFLSRYYQKKVIILLDEYDTPMQEAYVNGYWNELVSFTRGLFNAAFKTNPWLERAIMTGITRVSKESVFSDLNHLKVVTTTSDEYAESFGFTENEVFAAMDEFGYMDKGTIKKWYDGFCFGEKKDIYNPWSIINFLDTGKTGTYWANTSSNSLVGKLIREGSRGIKTSFELLLNGEHLKTAIDEQIVYNQLDSGEEAIWSLLLASGYLKVVDYEKYGSEELTKPKYELALTNLEVKIMFESMIDLWFSEVRSDYNDFIKALLLGDLDAMNEYMNRVTEEIFSSFDVGKKISKRAEPERFYHGFVLGLMVELKNRYVITSNRESGFGRYDVVLEPISDSDNAFIIEFKVFDSRKEKELADTLTNALQQIEEKKYEAALTARGIAADRIRKYGFVFSGKQVLIGGNKL